MTDFGHALALAAALLARLDPELVAIVLLSLRVSLSAAALAFAAGTLLGAALAVFRFRGRGAIVVLANALLGLPPVVVGLVVYVLLSRTGPLGGLGWLFTPAGMVAAQTVLALPVVVALVHRAVEALWAEYSDALRIDGASRVRAIPIVLAMGRAGLATAFLAAFGRSIAEVGAITIVGGNIRGYTRTMTTAISLETSRGDLPLALALGLILVTLTLGVSFLTLLVARAAR